MPGNVQEFKIGGRYSVEYKVGDESVIDILKVALGKDPYAERSTEKARAMRAYRDIERAGLIGNVIYRGTDDGFVVTFTVLREPKSDEKFFVGEG